jgi:hypothetical protein
LDIHPKEISAYQRDVFIPVFIAALFTIAKGAGGMAKLIEHYLTSTRP